MAMGRGRRRRLPRLRRPALRPALRRHALSRCPTGCGLAISLQGPRSGCSRQRTAGVPTTPTIAVLPEGHAIGVTRQVGETWPRSATVSRWRYEAAADVSSDGRSRLPGELEAGGAGDRAARRPSGSRGHARPYGSPSAPRRARQRRVRDRQAWKRCAHGRLPQGSACVWACSACAVGRFSDAGAVAADRATIARSPATCGATGGSAWLGVELRQRRRGWPRKCSLPRARRPSVGPHGSSPFGRAPAREGTNDAAGRRATCRGDGCGMSYFARARAGGTFKTEEPVVSIMATTPPHLTGPGQRTRAGDLTGPRRAASPAGSRPRFERGYDRDSGQGWAGCCGGCGRTISDRMSMLALAALFAMLALFPAISVLISLYGRCSTEHREVRSHPCAAVAAATFDLVAGRCMTWREGRHRPELRSASAARRLWECDCRTKR